MVVNVFEEVVIFIYGVVGKIRLDAEFLALPGGQFVNAL
jgi:hypothetical protein